MSAVPRPFRPITPAALACATAAAFGLVGCEPAGEPGFARGEAYGALLPELRGGMTAEREDDAGVSKPVTLAGLDETLDVRFGSPSDPRVWTALPVHYGGGEVRAAVVELNDGETGALVELEPAGEDPDAAVPTAAVGDTLHWTDERGFPRDAEITAVGTDPPSVTVAGFTAETAPLDGGRLLIGPPDVLVHGRELYVRHCLHCHGAGGAGDGPTARYLYPKPRNYLPGIFKFTSTGTTERVSRDDLSRVLREGIPGTYMPAFHPALSDDDIDAVVEYVRWVAMRGETEKQMVAQLSLDYSAEAVAQRLESGETREEIVAFLPDTLEFDLPDAAAYAAGDLADTWDAADEPEALVVPAEPRPADGAGAAASVLRGREIYLQQRSQCVSCHGVHGRGDGSQTRTVQTDDVTGEPYPVPGLHDAWGDPIRPRNLLTGVYRGGRRPVDIYRRIHAGIKGSKMPGFGAAFTDAEIWDLVNFVLALPHRPDLLDGAVPEEAPPHGSPGGAAADRSVASR